MWTSCFQSFVVALLTIVIATFSTGIDSQCFQVCFSNCIEVTPINCQSLQQIPPCCRWGRRVHQPKMQCLMLTGSSTLFSLPEQCTSRCCSSDGTLITSLRSMAAREHTSEPWHSTYILMNLLMEVYISHLQVDYWCRLDKCVGSDSERMAGCLHLQ